MEELTKQLKENEREIRQLIYYLNARYIPFAREEDFYLANQRDKDALDEYRQRCQESYRLVKEIVKASGRDPEELSQQELDWELDRIKYS